MSGLSYLEMRQEMVKVAKMMWERRLTNAAGGNFAVKVAPGLMLVSPSLMSERRHCDLDVSDFLLVDFDMNVVEGEGKLSRESFMHRLILGNFDTIGCTIHAHPFWSMVYVVQAKPIPSVSEATLGRGDVGCIPYTKAYTKELSENVYRYFEEHRAVAEKKPIGCILPLHGVVVSGPDIYMAYSMLERVECDAVCGIFKNSI
jgi:L-fuculose-phosphate aldolase